MLTFIVYLVTGLATLLPVLWLMLGAWMGVPIVWSEYVAGVGSCLLIGAAYLTLFESRTGAVFASAGLLATVPFWLIEPIKGLRAEGRSFVLWGILAGYIVVGTLCALRVRGELGPKS